jgi:hypothetical protein
MRPRYGREASLYLPEIQAQIYINKFVSFMCRIHYSEGFGCCEEYLLLLL